MLIKRVAPVTGDIYGLPENARTVPSASRSFAQLRPETFLGVRMVRPPRDACGETGVCCVSVLAQVLQ